MNNNTTFTQVHDLLQTINLKNADRTTLETTTTNIRRCQRTLDRILITISQHTTELHKQGQAPPAKELLAGNGDVSSATAKREAQRAKTLAKAPELQDALDNDEITPEHLDIAGQHLGALNNDQLEHLDTGALADAAKDTNPDDFKGAARNLADRARADWGRDHSIEERRKSKLNMWRDQATGMGRINGWVDPERYDFFRDAINTETTNLANNRRNDPDTPQGVDSKGIPVKKDEHSIKKDEHLAMDALIELITRGTASTTAGSAARPLIHVHADADTILNGHRDDSLSETSDGSPLCPEALQRLLCDSIIQTTMFGPDGITLNVGNKRRTATDKQWSAIRSMYRTCAWKSCGTIVNHCQLHHIKFWEHGGPSNLDNFVPLCSHHHHMVHDLRWTLKLDADRTLHLIQPDGNLWRSVKPDRPSGLTSAGTSGTADKAGKGAGAKPPSGSRPKSEPPPGAKPRGWRRIPNEPTLL